MAEIAGLKLIVPSSVAGSGVSVSASGKVSFTAATEINVNGVFSSTYDNYLMVFRTTTSISDTLAARFRLSGTDSTTGYTYQRMYADGGSVGANRETTRNRAYFSSIYTTAPNGLHLYLYGPSLAQPTAYRSVTVLSSGSAQIYDYVGTHSEATAYDGMTLIPTTGAITGALTIYGLSQ